MDNFIKLLETSIEDNHLESLVPSREYTENERIHMRGYTKALNDMLEDFTAEYSEFLENLHSPSLN
jgi:hypothetical protein